MRRLPILIAVLFAGLLASGALHSVLASSDSTRDPAVDPVGIWHAEGGAAQIDVRECGGALCGHVVWLRSPFDEHGCGLRDQHNPEESLRQQPVAGLEILRGLVRSPNSKRVWTGGTIYDPGSGNTYRATLTVAEENRLELRGYVGVPLLGRTETWIRVGSEQAMCSEVSATGTKSR